MIFVVLLQMLRKPVDAVGQQRDLHVRRASVLLVQSEILHDSRFAFHVSIHLLFVSSA
jgi:hypothetical protein